MSKHIWQRVCAICLVILFLTACSSLPGTTGNGGTTPTPAPTVASHPSPTAAHTVIPPIDTCPHLVGYPPSQTYCYTPHQFQLAYGVDALLNQGFTGKGQTVVDIVSFGSPTLQKDMDVFDQQFHLPPISLQIISPLGTKPFNPASKDMQGWAGETTLDVQIIHAIAPDAGIVVLTSPVSETEGTIGLPEFLQLEQYAVAHHLGTIVSQSWGASEVTLNDAAGLLEIQKWDAFFQKATTQQGMTFLSSSGDNGVTDYSDLQATKISTTPTTSFPSDDPWVTSVGGTRLVHADTSYQESVWNDEGGASGGGFSSFFPTPSYQKTLPSSVQNQLQNHRGVPDVAGDADPLTGLVFYQGGQWSLAGGTSASAPLWAGLMAIANQMAGHPLGFINTALYKLGTSGTYAQDFHDITVGDNTYANKGVIVPGYSATSGWDPTTGLGTPNAVHLLPDLITALKP
nr:S53 family peptidase [Ktedonobacteraceae bacterium]